MSALQSSSSKARVRRVEEALRRVYGDLKPHARRNLVDQLVGTILSQNTTDTNSRRAFQELRRAFPRWEDVMLAPTQDVIDAIRSAGLANTKAPRIQAILASVWEERRRLSLAHLSKMGDQAAMEYLTSLPGVGPKTAACVLLFGMGRDVFPVDTHVHRLCRRLGFVPDESAAEEAQELMAGLVPPGRSLSLHLNLVRHGRGICKARRPLCDECVLVRMCPSARGRQDMG